MRTAMGCSGLGETTMTKYAAYDDLSIYAVGKTRAAAIATARHDAKSPNARFSTAPISDALAIKIERDGWNGHFNSFSIDSSGWIVDTTA